MKRPLIQFQPMLAALITALATLLFTGCGRGTPEPATAPVVHAVVLVAAPKPEAPLPPKASCVTPVCHVKYQTAAHIHGPVSAGSCESCHQPDQGGHKYPLIRQGNATCTFCHAVAGTKAHQHKVIEQQSTGPAGTSIGGCQACHDPHTSKAKFLLVTDTIDSLCAKCHDLPLKKHAHQPFAAGQCTVCHQPHQSDFATLLRNGDGVQHCFGCHTDKAIALAQQPHVHKPALQACTTCHGPHSTDNPKLLKLSTNDTCMSCHKNVKVELAQAKIVHGAVASGCATCHDPHASPQPNELKARTDKVCLGCHDKEVKTTDGRLLASMTRPLNAKNLHGPVKSGSCSECHLPHAADQPNLLKVSFPDTFYAKFDIKDYALCFSCHDQKLVLSPTTRTLTDFRNGDQNLHFVHVNRADKGRSCKSCHDVHGSDLPRHMASSVPFEGSNWAMPIHFEPTATGGTCAPGCHDEKTYNRNKPATRPAERGQP